MTDRCRTCDAPAGWICPADYCGATPPRGLFHGLARDLAELLTIETLPDEAHQAPGWWELSSLSSLKQGSQAHAR